MTFTPGYGETPITDEEAEALLPEVRETLGEPISKADVYDLEQAIAEEVAEERATAVISGAVGLEELLTEHFIRDLHNRLYGDIWQWAGQFRRRDMNIGVPFAQIAVELRMSFDSILYRWEHTADWTARELGIAVHAETVRIHPFTDGNGRTTRMLADLVFLATQSGAVPEQYDWEIDKPQYIALLREFDLHRNAKLLAAFIPVRALGA